MGCCELIFRRMGDEMIPNLFFFVIEIVLIMSWSLKKNLQCENQLAL